MHCSFFEKVFVFVFDDNLKYLLFFFFSFFFLQLKSNILVTSREVFFTGSHYAHPLSKMRHRSGRSGLSAGLEAPKAAMIKLVTPLKDQNLVIIRIILQLSFYFSLTLTNCNSQTCKTKRSSAQKKKSILKFKNWRNINVF